MNVCAVLASGFDSDLNEKLKWAIPLQELYGHSIFIICRSKDTPQYYGGSVSINCINNSSYINKFYDEKSLQELERYIGISFRFILSQDYRFYNSLISRDKRNINDASSYLASLVEFYREFLTKQKISIVVIGLEILPFSLILYYVAKKLKIPIMTMLPARFPKPGVMFCKEDFSSILVWNEKNDNTRDFNLNLITSLYSNKKVKASNLELINYLNPLLLAENAKKALNYHIKREKMLKVCRYEEYVIHDLKFSVNKLLNSTFRMIFNRSLFKPIDSNDLYFFYPLHYMDEAQVTLRDPFVDQLKIIENISRALPKGVYLYVKPHPHYLATDISYWALRKMSNLDNVKIIDPSLSPISLIRDCIGIITINSTTGFESLIFKKPVISFGHDFYCQNDICYIIRDFNELPLIIYNVYTNNQNTINYNKVENFVLTVYANTVFTEGRISASLPSKQLNHEDGKKIAYALDRLFNIYY